MAVPAVAALPARKVGWIGVQAAEPVQLYPRMNMNDGI
jgi:hypothetical protein